MTPALRDAVLWEVRLREAAPGLALDAEHHRLQRLLRAFEHWRAASAANAQAWDALQERLARLGGTSEAGQSDGPGSAPGASAMAAALRVPHDERRRALRAAFGMLVLGMCAWSARPGRQRPGYDADWRSAAGHQGMARLADGTAMSMTPTAVSAPMAARTAVRGWSTPALRPGHGRA